MDLASKATSERRAAAMRLALAMALHPRLGAASWLRHLSTDLLRLIIAKLSLPMRLEFAVQSAHAMMPYLRTYVVATDRQFRVCVIAFDGFGRRLHGIPLSVDLVYEDGVTKITELPGSLPSLNTPLIMRSGEMIYLRTRSGALFTKQRKRRVRVRVQMSDFPCIALAGEPLHVVSKLQR